MAAQNKRLEERIALITGAGSGIGRATALRFAREGARVIAVDKNFENAEATIRMMESTAQPKSTALKCDISISSDIKEMAKAVFGNYSRLDILINNAGIGTFSFGELYKLSENIWDEVMNVNLRGTWLVTKEFVKKMKKQEFRGELRGKVINVSSLAGKLPSTPLGAYSISKAGVIAMTQIFAQELAPFKITVNAVCPGFHKTAIYLNDENLVKFGIKAWGGKLLLERIGTADDVANVLFFLASDDSNYMTGQSLNCGGGCHFS
ncbi:MAG TPA: SDR family oxidoreductase [Candidatus Deferrimicrobium sp.]|nr:SDR family oxidoreductase [Candidatus Deferrimicrobium sp.]